MGRMASKKCATKRRVDFTVCEGLFQRRISLGRPGLSKAALPAPRTQSPQAIREGASPGAPESCGTKEDFHPPLPGSLEFLNPTFQRAKSDEELAISTKGLIQGIHILLQFLSLLKEIRIKSVKRLELSFLNADGVEEAGVAIARHPDLIRQRLDPTNRAIQLVRMGEIAIGELALKPQEPIGDPQKPATDRFPEDPIRIPPLLFFFVSGITGQKPKPSLQSGAVRFHALQDLIHRNPHSRKGV